MREFELNFKFELFGHPYGKFMEKIGLKAPGNHSASFQINNFSILVLENFKTLMFMISGFLGLVWTFVDGFNILKIFNTYNVYSYKSLNIRSLMVNGSWLKAHGSWPKEAGPVLGPWAAAPGPRLGQARAPRPWGWTGPPRP